MKKSIFKAYWLVVLSICMLASCTSQKEEIETNNTIPNEIAARKNVRTRSTLPPVSDVYDIPAYIGALHNASIYAFVEYVAENALNPFIEDGFSNEMIETFAQNYVMEHLGGFEYLCDFDIELDTNVLNAYGVILYEILSYDMGVADINNCIEEATTNFYMEYAIESPNDIVYDIVKEIAKATNTLWGEEWDFSNPIFENPDPEYMSNANDNNGDNNGGNNGGNNGSNSGNNSSNNSGNNNDDSVKQNEDLERLKHADLAGAAGGAAGGFVTGLMPGPPSIFESIMTGAAGGAIGGSIQAMVDIILENQAIYMRPEYVAPDTYFHELLRRLKQTVPQKFYTLYGTKFDDVIY